MSSEISAGRVIWITGLSGSGKTSLARALMPRLSGPKLLLDGDELREALSLLGGGYDLPSRRRLALTYARLAKLAADQGQTVVCATISMFQEVRNWNRQNLPGYLEVYLEASAEDCRAADEKGVYDSDEVVGLELSPELPSNSDLILQARSVSLQIMVKSILALRQKGEGKE